MPVMIRPSRKSSKIAWAILGVPANIQNKKNAFQKKIDEKLQYQNTTRSR